LFGGDLFETGLDALNPVQITCSWTDAAPLKPRFGRELTFWGGGCDTREILTSGRAREPCPGQGQPKEVKPDTYEHQTDAVQ